MAAPALDGSLAQSARPWWAIAVVCLGYAGYFKGTPIMAGFPVDLTAAAAVMCGVGIVLQVIRGRWFEARGLMAVLGLWAVFGVGALMIIGSDQSRSKATLLGTVTLLCALAPCYLLIGAVAQRWLLASTVVAAALLIGAAFLMPDVVARDDFGRLNVEGTTTIGTSRVVGAGILVAAVYALSAARRRWIWCLGMVAGMSALVAVGSRGPFVAVLISLTVVVLSAKILTGKRLRAVGLGAVALGLLAIAVSRSPWPSADRIALFVMGDQTDVAREFLAQEALRSIAGNPLGLGWGGFSTTPTIELAYGGLPVYPHNLTLEMVAEGGWLAGALFLVLVYWSMRGFVRASSTADRTALLGLGVYWLVVAQTSSDINGNRMTWIMLVLGLTMAIRSPQGAGRRQWSPVRERLAYSGDEKPVPVSNKALT